MELDRDYVRRVGEEVREALFPREREDGRHPTSMPASLRYHLADGYEVDVRFVPLRTYQWIDEEAGGAPDVPLTTVDVTFEGYYIGAIDLEFGKELDDEHWVGDSKDGPGTWPERDEALNALLRAIKGTLEADS